MRMTIHDYRQVHRVPTVRDVAEAYQYFLAEGMDPIEKHEGPTKKGRWVVDRAKEGGVR